MKKRNIKFIILCLLAVLTMSFVFTACEEKDIEQRAKNIYLINYVKKEYPKAKIRDISYRPFLGSYNESLVAVFYGGKYHGAFPDIVDTYEIEELTFNFSRGYPILVWNNDKIFDLPAAYEQGLLTKENLMVIYKLYRKID